VKEAVKYLKNQDTGVPEVIKHNLLETIRTLEVPWERLYLRDALGFERLMTMKLFNSWTL
jgi:hypothetical protein